MKNLKTMTLDALLQIRDTADRLISQKVVSERRDLEAKLAKIQSITGAKGYERRGRGATKGRSVAPKYRNPDDSSQTWAGRGNMPRWLRAFIEQGRKQEDF